MVISAIIIVIIDFAIPSFHYILLLRKLSECSGVLLFLSHTDRIKEVDRNISKQRKQREGTQTNRFYVINLVANYLICC